MPGRVKLTTEAHEAPVLTKTTKRKAADEEVEDAPRSPTKRSRPVTPASTRSTTPIDDAEGKRPAGRAPRKQQSKPRLKKYACTYTGCDKAFARPCRLEEHIRSHTGDRPFKCTEDPASCDKSFLRDSHLKAHIKAMHLKSKSYRCKFLIPAGVEQDLGRFGFKRKASEPPVGPPDEGGMVECGAGFTTNQHLKRHIESHLKTYPYICTEYPPCQAGFRKKGPLTRHIRSVHLKVQPWVCTHQDVDNPEKTCDAAFDTKGKLGNHVATKHSGLEKRRYVCTMCVVRQNDPLPPWPPALPLLRIPGPPPTQPEPEPASAPAELSSAPPADIDNQVLADASLLLSLSRPRTTSLPPPTPQLPTPTTEHPPRPLSQPPQSSLPQAPLPTPPESQPTTQPLALGPSPALLRAEGLLGFTTHRELRTHIALAHPPTCKFCPYRARRPRDLRNHLRVHHETTLDERRQHLCFWPDCLAEFTTKHNLKTHLRAVHEGKKPFSCPHCSESFGYKHVLENHINRHANGGTRKKNEKNKRKRRTREMGVIESLTGHGYEDTGRDIQCVVQGCTWRFYRVYDLRVHLGAAKGHGLGEEGVEALLKAAGWGRDVDPDETVSEVSSDGTESGWSDGSESESGSESDAVESGDETEEEEAGM